MTRIIWPSPVSGGKRPHRRARGNGLARFNSRMPSVRDAAHMNARPHYQVPRFDPTAAMPDGTHSARVPDPSVREPIGQPPTWECSEAEKAWPPIAHAGPEYRNPSLLGTGQCRAPVFSRNSRAFVAPSLTRRGPLSWLSSPNSSCPSGCERGPLRLHSLGVRSWTGCAESAQQVGCLARFLKPAVKPRAAGDRQNPESARRIRVQI